MKSIYIINPRSDFPTYYGAEVFAASGLPNRTLIADLATVTLAALVPDGLRVELCDENLSPIRYDADVDFVAITGKITQSASMKRIASQFRDRGRTVLIGGPYASLSPRELRPYCDILVRGEIEGISQELFGDLMADSWKDEYRGGRPDLTLCPRPAWGLYPNSAALLGAVQTSRGCPFECEFCDVIQYLGRKQRHKPVAQVLAELDQVYGHGYRHIFLADDNFTVHRSRAKELLVAIRDWQTRKGKALTLYTQVSIDAARDEELLRMCAEAGLTSVFIGIETPNEDSLRESRKRQNLNIELLNEIGRFLEHGIAVSGGMIVGFDSDGLDIFETQYRFAMASPIPIFSLGALVAPEATPLHARMKEAGRLVGGSEVAASPWSTNISPLQMSRRQLIAGLRDLCERLYHPSAFARRVLHFAQGFRPRIRQGAHACPAEDLSSHDPQVWRLLGRLSARGPEEALMWSKVKKVLADNREARRLVISMLMQYAQILYMYEAAGLRGTTAIEGSSVG
ncbi:MAG TPA: radical SAM protein, partial [Acidobacteriota bacterium]|nr:radical SAM protein [Acidobacteriota bacterium]